MNPPALQEQAPTVYYSPIEEGNAAAWLNNEKLDVQLTFQFSGKLYSWFGEHYWMLAAGLGAVCIAYMGAALYRESKGKCTLIMLVEGIWTKYGFLIDQLVSRDFKTKYKRSVLGYCWSFLNPLLTMMVQYVVFSTIFKNDIENFPVYLLTGTILFSFFQEAVGQGLTSILANASLITKVYMPKYIYSGHKSGVNVYQLADLHDSSFDCDSPHRGTDHAGISAPAICAVLPGSILHRLFVDAVSGYGIFQRYSVFVGNCESDMDVCDASVLPRKYYSGRVSDYSEDKSALSHRKNCESDID